MCKFQDFKDKYDTKLYKYVSKHIREHDLAAECCYAAWKVLELKWNQVKSLKPEDIYTILVKECKKHICNHFLNKYVDKINERSDNIVIADPDCVCRDLNKKFIPVEKLSFLCYLLDFLEKPLSDTFKLYFMEGKNIETIHKFLPSYTQDEILNFILRLRNLLKNYFGM